MEADDQELMPSQENTEIESSADPRKYVVGMLLTFRNCDQDEVSVVPFNKFRRGDVLRVLPRNGCGMGIDVVRLSDGTTDMVWPTEVQVRRRQAFNEGASRGS